MLYRSDDVAFGSNVEQLREIRGIFESFGLKEMYSVVPFGGNLYDGNPFSMGLQALDKVLGDKNLVDDKDVIEFIEESLNRGHSISLHGWRHTIITSFDFEGQFHYISIAKKALEDMFNQRIFNFIPPFNNFNQDTQKVCDELGLTILGTSEHQLERSVREDRPFDKTAPYYWYHWFRFFQSENLAPKMLEEYFKKELS